MRADSVLRQPRPSQPEPDWTGADWTTVNDNQTLPVIISTRLWTRTVKVSAGASPGFVWGRKRDSLVDDADISGANEDHKPEWQAGEGLTERMVISDARTSNSSLVCRHAADHGTLRVQRARRRGAKPDVHECNQTSTWEQTSNLVVLDVWWIDERMDVWAQRSTLCGSRSFPVAKYFDFCLSATPAEKMESDPYFLIVKFLHKWLDSTALGQQRTAHCMVGVCRIYLDHPPTVHAIKTCSRPPIAGVYFMVSLVGVELRFANLPLI